MRFLLMGIMGLFGSNILHSQSLTHVGILPRINYTSTLNDQVSLNFTFFSEIDPEDNRVGNKEFPSKVLNLTFVGGLAYKFDQNNILTAAYLFRVIDPFESENLFEHRLIQQFVHIHHLDSWRLRHHLRIEERFIESANSGNFNGIMRLSYSIGWDVPLQGKHLDQNEFYLNSVSSYFVQPTKPRTSFHNLTETYLGLGYKTKKIGRFEIGPEAKLSVRNSNKDLNAFIFIDFIWYPNFKGK